MPFVLSLACTHLKMSPAEAIAAATINGAWALRLQERKGSIEPGKDADLAVFDVADYREIAYWVASNRCAFSVLNGADGGVTAAIATRRIRPRSDLSEPNSVAIIVPVPNASSVLTARIDWQFRPSPRVPDDAHRAGRQAVSQNVAR